MPYVLGQSYNSDYAYIGYGDTGWTQFTPTGSWHDGYSAGTGSSVSNVLYVSHTDGSDSNDGSHAAPYQTLAHAKGQLRDHSPDWLLLKQGDTWTDETLFPLNKRGLSADEPMLIASYGTTGVSGSSARGVLTGASPILKTSSAGASANPIGHDPSIPSDYVAYQDLYCWLYKAGPEYNDGTFSATDSYLVQYPNWDEANLAWLLIEGCTFRRYYEFSLQPMQTFPERHMGTIIFRRNKFIDSLGGGTLIGSCETPMVFEENVMDACGLGQGFNVAQNVTITAGSPAVVSWPLNWIISDGTALAYAKYGITFGDTGGGVTAGTLYYVYNNNGTTFNISPYQTLVRSLTTTNASATLTGNFTNGYGSILTGAGSTIVGTNITSGTTISSIASNFTIVGQTTNQSPTITGISSTAAITVGDYIADIDTPTNLPANTTIISKTSNTVTMSANYQNIVGFPSNFTIAPGRVTMNKNATGSGTQSLTVTPAGASFINNGGSDFPTTCLWTGRLSGDLGPSAFKHNHYINGIAPNGLLTGTPNVDGVTFNFAHGYGNISVRDPGGGHWRGGGHIIDNLYNECGWACDIAGITANTPGSGATSKLLYNVCLHPQNRSGGPIGFYVGLQSGSVYNGDSYNGPLLAQYNICAHNGTGLAPNPAMVAVSGHTEIIGVSNNYVFDWLANPAISDDTGVGVVTNNYGKPINSDTWSSSTGFLGTPDVIPEGDDTVAGDERTIETYDSEILGGPGTLDHFMTLARANLLGNWNHAYTARAVNDYIQSGVGLEFPSVYHRVRLSVSEA